jgi:hypothetical protein
MNALSQWSMPSAPTGSLSAPGSPWSGRAQQAAPISGPPVDPSDVLRIALGLDPSLPWDRFLAGQPSVPSVLRGTMERQHSAFLLRAHLASRIAAEHILEGSWMDGGDEHVLAETWLAAKASHNGSLLQPPDIWSVRAVLREESSRVGLSLPKTASRHITLPLFLRDFTLLLQPSDCSSGAPSSQWESPGQEPLPRLTRRGARGKRMHTPPAFNPATPLPSHRDPGFVLKTPPLPSLSGCPPGSPTVAPCGLGK